MLRLIAAVCVLAFVSGSAVAATLTPDLNPLHTTHETQLRDGDFDGNGQLDDLYLVAEDSGRVAVHVRLNGTRDLRITSLEAAANTTPNLQVVAPGAFASDCGDYASDCAGAIVTRHDSLILGLDGGASVLVHWQDGRFEQDFVRRDDAAAVRALAGLLALNP
ncbi:hypothetical protein ABI_28680 [Asticcacaulis biprosthecium C19]|uniref:Uncharacterized protein n=1 Tax=Asticcacaulis biprosthecium C19 TaxID=715226 RepID=F4QML1_9CAUL|nr:hypothetical protein [Asticcacaulis biprosthecium]EGF91452.1 hypothetical protein ABI_28680 [Asticcacaulis biprosthecium C19]